MVRRALFLSAAIFCGSVSFANASATSAACAAGNGGAAATELSGVGGLSGSAKRDALDSIALALGSESPTSAAGRAGVASCLREVAALYEDPADQQRVQDIASAVTNSPNEVATAALGTTADGGSPDTGGDARGGSDN